MRVRSSLMTAVMAVSFLAVIFLSLAPARLAFGQEKRDGGTPAENPRAPAEAQADKVTPDDDAAHPSTAESLLRKAEAHAAKQLAARDAERRPLRDHMRGLAQYPVGYDDAYYYGPYGGYYPWYRLPPTAWVKDYPPPITHIPQLGLHHNYPFAYQMGIRLPDDSDPLYVEPNLAPFVGVVGAAKAELAQAAVEEKQDSGDDRRYASAIARMQSGKYKEAGRLLADHFQATEDPGDALLLAEVFFALGKPSHAEMLLRHALDSDNVLAVLPVDISKHFASADEVEKKLQDLDSSGEHRLLFGYLKVHSKNPDAGLEILSQLMKDNPKDKGVARLYRYYLGKAFQE